MTLLAVVPNPELSHANGNDIAIITIIGLVLFGGGYLLFWWNTRRSPRHRR